MLIACSGSQGCGKTTLLNMLKEDGHNVVTRKTSRSILEDWGVSLQEVNNNHNLTIKFQEEILTRKIHDDVISTSRSGNQIFFTERTFADLFTYALVTLGKENKYSEWLNDYYIRCMEAQQNYAYVFYLSAGHFTVEHDGVRGSNPHYSRMIDLAMSDFTKQMTHPSLLSNIATPVLEERKAIIVQHTLHFFRRYGSVQFSKELLFIPEEK